MTQTDSGKEIFISYAWGGDSETIVDEIARIFAEAGYSIERDKTHLNYRKSIREFMDSIGRGKYIIVVVSDKYMKSEYCMYEAYRMFQSPQIGDRILPIVLPDADIFSFAGQQKYLRYWMQEVKRLEEEIKAMASEEPTMLGPIIERLRDYEVTSRFVNDFMAQVADMNVLTPEMHRESNFDRLLEVIGGARGGSTQADRPKPPVTELENETTLPPAEARPLNVTDLGNDPDSVDRLVKVLAAYFWLGMPTPPQLMAQNLILSTHWPSDWKQLRISALSGMAELDARGLVEFAIGRGHLPAPNQKATAIGNLLEKAKPLLGSADLQTLDEITERFNL